MQRRDPSFFPSGFIFMLALSGMSGMACSDDAPAVSETTEETGDGDGDGDPGDGDGDGDGDPGDGDGDGDPFPGTPPDDWCPDGPSSECPEIPNAPLRVGVSMLDMVPDCFESWTDVAQNGKFDDTEDDFDDCGCDRLCDPDLNYPGPDEGEGDGMFQGSYIAGFGSNRPASGVRGAGVGLRGEGDGIWCRAVVFDQGDTRVAIVTIDTVGYFFDEVEAIRESLAPQNVDWLVVHAIHNHEGPDTLGQWGAAFLVPGFDPDYRAQVRMTVATAVTEAIGQLEEVGTMTVGRGDASTAHPPDMPEKGIRNISNDTRDPFAVDEAVDVLHFADTRGQTIVTLINFASHPESLGSDNTLLTADYVHALRETVEDGSQWETAPDVPGLGGPAIFINGAVGGMMTPLNIDTISPDGDTWTTGTFEQADTIGQLLGEIAIDAVANGEVVADPQLAFARQGLLIEVRNGGFQLLFDQGVFQREVVEMDGKGYVRSEMGVLELGPIRMLTVPGEMLPELAVGGYDGSQMFQSEVPLLDPNNINPPDLDAAPPGPYIKERMLSPYTWIIGLGNDELGYIIPEYNFELAASLPYINEAEGDHYEETNSIGPHITGIVDETSDALIAFLEWL